MVIHRVVIPSERPVVSEGEPSESRDLDSSATLYQARHRVARNDMNKNNTPGSLKVNLVCEAPAKQELKRF